MGILMEELVNKKLKPSGVKRKSMCRKGKLIRTVSKENYSMFSIYADEKPPDSPIQCDDTTVTSPIVKQQPPPPPRMSSLLSIPEATKLPPTVQPKPKKPQKSPPQQPKMMATSTPAPAPAPAPAQRMEIICYVLDLVIM